MWKINFVQAVTISLILVFEAGFASSQNMVTAAEPESILNIARGFGSAHQKKDSHGDPMILGRIEGIKYQIFFYNCEDGEECSYIQFRAFWRMSGVSFETMNEWNRKQLFGKAYLDDDLEPVIEMSVNLDYEGSSVSEFDDTFDMWCFILEEFQGHINIDEHTPSEAEETVSGQGIAYK